MAYYKPFYNRLGGKSRSLRYILEKLPESCETFVEPFFGSGWVFFNYFGAKNYVVNDLDIEVMKMVTAMRDGDYARLKSFDWKKSPETFYKLKAIFKDKETYLSKDNYEMLYTYRYLNYYGVLGDYETFNTTVPKKDIPPIERFIPCSEKLKDTNLRCQDYAKTVQEFDSKSTVFYMDPPYLFNPNTDRYRHGSINIDEFIDCVCKIKGHAVVSLSLKSVDTIHLHLLESKGYSIDHLTVRYGSDNLKKKDVEKKVVASKEILIYK